MKNRGIRTVLPDLTEPTEAERERAREIWIERWESRFGDVPWKTAIEDEGHRTAIENIAIGLTANRRERAMLDYMIQTGVECHETLLDDPPMTDENREKYRRLAECLDPGLEPLPEPEIVTEGVVDRAHLLSWFEREALAADLRAGFSPSFPGNALRTAANWIRTAYRPDKIDELGLGFAEAARVVIKSRKRRGVDALRDAWNALEEHSKRVPPNLYMPDDKQACVRDFGAAAYLILHVDGEGMADLKKALEAWDKLMGRK